MDRRGTERVDRSRGEGEMNVTKRGQAVTEVGQTQDKISTATEVVFIHLDQFGSGFKRFSGHFCLSTFSPLLICTLQEPL